jgi:hypothetical protein
MTISQQVDPVATSADADAAEFVAGFQRVEGEVRAVTENELLHINIEVPGAVATVLGALPEVRAFRGEMSQLAGFDLKRFDKLRDYTLALGHTHAMYRAASGPADGVTELAEEVSALRDTLQADAAALARRGILDLGTVNKLRAPSGYKNIAFEVVGLVGLFREHWANIVGRSALKPEELEHAGRRAQELVTAVGLREQAPVAVGAASALRQRAFTLFANAYDDARRAILYLRWHHGDADDIAPSLYKGRGGRGGTDAAPAPDVPPAPNPEAPAPIASASVPAGLPGASPFVAPRP